MSLRVVFAALAPSLALLGAPAAAEETAAPPAASSTGQGDIIVYTPENFAGSQPSTALDLVNRLPGFTLDTGENTVRGFAGAAGNVLIDGQRPTAKTDTLSNILARIPVSQVERVELIRGGAPGIDMQGRSVIANIVRKQTNSVQQILTLSDLVYADTGQNLPGWKYEFIRQSGQRQVEFQLGRALSYDDSVGSGDRTTTYFDGRPQLFLRAGTEADGSVHSSSGSYRSPLFGGLFAANALLSHDDFKDEAHFWNDTAFLTYIGRTSNNRGEIGLNFKRPIGARFETETLGLFKLAKGEGRYTGDDESGDSLFAVEARAGETIGRTILRYRHSDALTFEAGGEAAFNFRNQSVALTVDGTSIALPSSDVRVEELRGEAFLQATWRMSSKWSVEGGVRVERSTISESGDAELERTFVYPKPRLLATWSPSQNDQVRFRVEREVGQLDFRQFASNVSLNSGVLSAGNPDLEPDKTQVYEAAYEKRFWGGGALIVTLRHEDISDAADVKPFTVLTDANGDGVPDDADGDGAPDQLLVAGPGNIGSGTNDVIEVDLTLPLGRLGVPGGELKAKVTYQNSVVTDPLTHDERRISDQRPDTINVGFRQDIPAWNLTYGIDYFGGWSERSYELTQISTRSLDKFWTLYAEIKPTPRFAVRAEVMNFDPYTFVIERQVYDGPRDTSGLTEVETELRYSQVIGFVRARMQF